MFKEELTVNVNNDPNVPWDLSVRLKSGLVMLSWDGAEDLSKQLNEALNIHNTTAQGENNEVD